MQRQQFLICYKIGFAVLVLVAITAQLDHGLQQSHFSLVNFFSFFTIDSNLLGATILLMAAYKLSNNQKRDHEFESLRGAATLYMVATGIIYILLLSGADVQTPLPWVNAILHYIFPVVMLADWLYDKPSHKVTAKQSLLWLVFPVIYVTYSLVHGPLAHHWYPYPFLNVSGHGYPIVIINSVIIGVVFAALAFGIAQLPQKLAAKTVRPK